MPSEVRQKKKQGKIKQALKNAQFWGLKTGDQGAVRDPVLPDPT